jgi:hypothetical protein
MVSRLWLSQAGAPANGKHHNLREAVSNAEFLKDFYFAFIKEGNTPLCDASAPLGFALRNAYKAA